MPLPMTSGWSLLRLWLLCSGDWREAFGTLFLHCSVALSRNRRGNELNFPPVNGGLGIREAQLPALGCDAAYLRSAGHADCGRAPRRCNGPVGESRTAHCGCSCRPACQRPAGTRSQNCMWPRTHGCRKKAVEVAVKPTPVQTDELVPPRSVAREAAYAKLSSRILSAAEATQAARLRQELSPEQQAIMLSAGGILDGNVQIFMDILRNA